MIFSVMYLFAVSAYTMSLNCNYIDMGFNVIHPVSSCVVGKYRDNQVMSMEHICMDQFTVQSRLYDNNAECNGDDYQVLNTFNCNSNSTFVKCDCSFTEEEQCSLVTDIQYKKAKDGECDTSQIMDHRTYIVDSNEIPAAFMDDNNCFERKSDNKS